MQKEKELGVEPQRTYTRRTSRYCVEMRVRVTPDKGNTGNHWFGQANDISEFGMSLFVPTELEVGSTIRIDFTLPYCSQKLVLRGTVRNRQSFRYGIEFYYPTQMERDVIVRACKMMSVLQ